MGREIGWDRSWPRRSREQQRAAGSSRQLASACLSCVTLSYRRPVALDGSVGQGPNWHVMNSIAGRFPTLGRLTCIEGSTPEDAARSHLRSSWDGDSAHTQLAGTTFSARCSIAGCWRHVKFLHKLGKLKLGPSDAGRVRVGALGTWSLKAGAPPTELWRGGRRRPTGHDASGNRANVR